MRKTLALLLFSLAACGGDTPATGPNDPNGSSGTGIFKATIDGQPWEATLTTSGGTGVAPNSLPGGLQFDGTTFAGTNSTHVGLSLGYISGPGTYPLGVNEVSTAGGTGTFLSGSGAAVGTWWTPLLGGGGSVTITSLTSARVAGTFLFTATAFSLASGTKTITNGVFDFPLPAGFAVAPPSNKGSRVSGTLGGVPWNAATVAANVIGGAFGLAASTDSITLTLTLGSIVTAGTTYPIGGAGSLGVPAGATMTVLKRNPTRGWSSGFDTPVGSVTFTSLGGNRATGSYTATLIAAPGTSGSLAVSGTFDVRIDPQ